MTEPTMIPKTVKLPCLLVKPSKAEPAKELLLVSILATRLKHLLRAHLTNLLWLLPSEWPRPLVGHITLCLSMVLRV